MELLFLWIEDFRNIQKQPFNFSPYLNFTVKADSKSTEKYPSYTINVVPNTTFVNLFSDNILNVTGVIGKNGSGKSTLLNCLKLMTGQFARLTSPLIFSALDKESKQLFTYYYAGGGIAEMKPLRVSLIVDSSVKNIYIQDAKPYTISRMQGDKGTIKGLDFDLSKITTCYYSNSFDSHREDIYEGVQNISSNFKVEQFLKLYIKQEVEKSRRRKGENRDLVLWPSHIAEFHKHELRSMLRFLAYANRRKSGLIPDLPRFLAINFNFDDYEFLITATPVEYPPVSEIVKKIHEQASRAIIAQADNTQRFYNLILLCTLYYYLRWHLVNRRFSFLEDRSAMFNALAENFEFYRLQESLIEIASYSSISRISIMRHVLSEQFHNSLKRVEIISTFNTELRTRFEFKINTALWPVLSAVYNLSHVDEITFVDYDWIGGLSTGEEAYLKHFSRLNDVRPLIKGETVWLLIDEGDLYFHPQWQKSYLKNLLIYSSFIFHNKKVQIILTTHSPFIVSDLPKQNLLFLKKDNKGCCIVADEKLQSETFGANIHELFSNSFFIHDGLMGELAKDKIDEVINWCTSKKKLNEDQVTHAKALIEIIGEPLIKFKLIEMLAQKLGENSEQARLESQRDEIERRLKDLKRNDSDKT